ncbi:DUF2971 domain-containing protein [Rathayibacter caricis]|uniref:DUF2971 domain-containing protein n=1 Tax=Rathayibacter caricis TaxID=110936 RepID=UPI001FB2A4C1|nr:DUF2971 domain-containing protein [Rathayibacter caricis]MCJ1694649.1 DUF2971 domain-containing protein [Rathayibacter caricis]
MRNLPAKAEVRPAGQEPPSDTFWHYTSAAGALGVLENKEFWATHVRFMNDHEEIQRFVRIVVSVLEEFYDNEAYTVAQLGLRGAKTLLTTWLPVNFFVVSFTTLPDSLSQWRAYSGGSNGYALGFSGESLRAAGEGWVFERCIYEQTHARDIAMCIVEESLTEYMSEPIPDVDDFGFFSLLDILYPRVIKYAAQIKHEAFADEREWRLIGGPFDDDRFNNRIGPRGITPYVKLATPKTEDGKIGLTEVVLGPGATKEMLFSVGTIIKMDEDYGDEISFCKSFAPYRM